MIINEINPNKVKQMIKNSKNYNFEIQSQDHDFNRRIIEYGKFKTIVFPNTNIKTRRKIKAIESGLDRVSAKSANKNKIIISYDLSKLHKLERKSKAIELEKLLELVKLSKKYFLSFKFINNRNKTISF